VKFFRFFLILIFLWLMRYIGQLQVGRSGLFRFCPDESCLVLVWSRMSYECILFSSIFILPPFPCERTLRWKTEKMMFHANNIHNHFMSVSGPNGEEYAWYQCTVSSLSLFTIFLNMFTKLDLLILFFFHLNMALLKLNIASETMG
jgi:hypothetical protein